MSKSKKLKLIEGEFQFREAKEILFNVFSTKINFHQRNNFSHKERFGKEDPTAKKRIPALKKELVKLEKILNEAEAKNKKLIIGSEITITLSDE
jgi:DNA-directed RNA polymerase subunit F